MPKIEVHFDGDFETDKIVPIHVGRLMIGTHIMRLYFYPDGKTRGLINEEAVTDGSLMLGSKHETILYGFNKEDK